MKKINKKGFTLVELLAVIAILAILMLLVTPNILTMFNNGRRDAFVTQIQSIWRAAESQYVSNSFGTSSTSNAHFSNFSGDKIGTLTTMKLNIGDTDAKYYVHVNGEGIVDKIGVSNNNYCYVANSGAKIDLSRTDVDDYDDKTLSCSYASSTVTCQCS